MKTDDSSTRFSLRRPQDGAVLVVVLLAMIGLLGMGLAGLYLTSGNIQMNSNINMRNQALYVAEGGIQVAKGILNRPYSDLSLPYLGGMLSGTAGPSGATVATPTGYTDELPVRAGTDASDYGCSGKSSSGVSTRGAYLRDDDPPPAGFGCQTSASTTAQPVYIDCNYPPTYSYTDSNGNSISYNATPPDPNGMSATPTQYMGKYTLFIRQDLGECRQGQVTIDGNGIVVIRSEGTASDNRTKVVLEVTMSTNPNTAILAQAIATVCPAGAAGCDDNASVQQGITVGPPGAGGVTGSGGSGGTGGTSAGCTNDGQCNGEICCNGACVDKTTSQNCGTCGNQCSGSTPACCNGVCAAATSVGTLDKSCGPCGGIDCTTSGKKCCGSGTNYTCVNETTDTNNCGACNRQCTSSQICCSGVCNTPRNPSTYSNTTCGPCSLKCTSTQICCSGVCQDSSNSQNHISNTCCGPCCNNCTSTGGCCGPSDFNHLNDGNYYSCITPSCGTIGTMGFYGLKEDSTKFPVWLAAHSNDCGIRQDLNVLDPNHPEITITDTLLGNYKIIAVLDVGHSLADYKAYQRLAIPNFNAVAWDVYTKQPTARKFSSAEGQALMRWVQNGGGLLVAEGYDDMLYSVGNFNTLVEPLGLVYSAPDCGLNPNCATTTGWDAQDCYQGYDATSYTTSPINLTTGVTKFFAGGYFPISGWPIPPAYTNNTTQSPLGASYTAWARFPCTKADKSSITINGGVAGTFGNGRVVALADEWIELDENWTNSQYASSTVALWNNMVNWLGHCP